MDQVSEIRSKIDIVQLIQEFIPLKRAGRNFKALCPFHTEKTPSFVVSPERQIWHCFSCSKGGDVYQFLMEYEHIEFPEALRILAQRAGVRLIQTGFNSKETSKKELYYTLNRLAAEFYHYLLTKHHVGESALSYLEKRKIKPATMKTFLLGFAPFGSSLVTYLTKKKGYKLQDILDTGLATKRSNGSIFDFFQNRIIFALFDHRDNIIGFSGRVLSDTEKTSKYINTRETLLYHKGSTFFGLNIAKEAIKKAGSVLLMEGEFDVISCFQEGITNVVAVKGTAVTEDQANLLSRFCQKVILCFDTDSAGQEALKRSLVLLEKKGLTTTTVIIPNGKDADESLQHDPYAFKQAVKNSINIYDYLLSQVSKKYDPDTVDGKKKIGQEILPFLAGIENEIVKEHYLQKLSEMLHISSGSLEKEIEKLKKQEITKKITVTVKSPVSREELLEAYCVALIVQSPNPGKLLPLVTQHLTDYLWQTGSLEKIIKHLHIFTSKYTTFDAKTFTNGLPNELIPTFDSVFLMPLPSSISSEAYEQELLHVLTDMQQSYIKQKIKQLSLQIKEKEQEEKTEEVEKLSEELTILLSKLSQK